MQLLSQISPQQAEECSGLMQGGIVINVIGENLVFSPVPYIVYQQIVLMYVVN